MKPLLVILLSIFSLAASASVSNNQYNGLVDDYNDLKDDYNRLVNKYNRANKTRYKEGSCMAYADKASAISTKLFSDTYTSELAGFLDLKKFNDYFLYVTKDISSTNNTAMLLKGLNKLRTWEAKAAENIGYARSGIEMADKFIYCSDSYENKEIIRGKKDLLEGVSEGIQHSQTLVNALYEELIETYENDSSFDIILDSNKYGSNDSRELNVYEYVMETLTKIKADDAYVSVERVMSYGDDDNQCKLYTSITAVNGTNYHLEFDFEAGISWSTPLKSSEHFKVDGETSGVNFSVGIGGEENTLQQLFVDKELREPLVKIFRKLHKECYKKSSAS